MSPRLLYLLTAGRRREDMDIRRHGRGVLSLADWRDMNTAEWRGYGLRAVPDAMIRRGA